MVPGRDRRAGSGVAPDLTGDLTQPIAPALFDFLRELEANNERSWFAANKERYLAQVRDPMLAFISAFAEPLARISPHFLVDPRPNGGSLFRIYRDTRFSKDKTPYKSNVGAHFRHAAGKDAHAPGFYLHLEPDTCFAGCGIWHPDNDTLGRIRDAIVERSDEWQRITSAETFRATFELAGGALKRAPRGYDPEHPLIDDLKRKDFVAVTSFSEAAVSRPDFLNRFAEIACSGAPLVGFLAEAVGVPC